MREILFRGFHKQEDGPNIAIIDGAPERGQWVYGDYHKYTCTTSSTIPTPTHYIMGTDASAKAQIFVESATVGQYTGLTDKNGKKIFEGDVVKHRLYHPPNTEGPELIGIVEFHKAAFSIAWSNFQEYGRNFAGYIAGEVEVIGTIYDASPEAEP